MSAGVHPAASHHLPGFITAPGETDVLMVASLIMLIGIILGIGVFYFRLHALPEQIAHKGEKVQFQIVAILSLLAMFTQNHAYWIAALLLAYMRIPDFSTPLMGMATSLGRIADAKGPRPKVDAVPKTKRAASAPAKPRRPKKAKEEDDA